jgi:O-antigen/teichoic acid export membrane protein
VSVVDPLDEIPAPTDTIASQSAAQPVLRNAIFLTIGQIVSVPLSMLTNAVTARYLGPQGFGEMYIGSTFNSCGFLFVEFGQGGVLPALVAADRSRAGAVLGSSLLWQSLAALAIFPLLIGLCYVLGYGLEIQLVVSLFFIGYTLSALSNVGQFVMLGLERGEVPAYRQILEQLAVLVVVVPILMLGGKVKAALVGHAVTTAIVFLYIWHVTGSASIRPLSVDSATLRTLFRRGVPFVFMGLAMTLQPFIDATFLSKLGSPDAVGWHSAARRLVGFLIFPASALVGALYPTLCRLHGADQAAFKDTTNNALRATSLLVIPVALGCLLYPDIGIAFYDRQLFRPAEDNVRILSLFVFLLYFTMPIGICILASGRQRAWTLVQSSCVLVSLVLDPLLVPWFQRRAGNGGLGVAAASAVSEVIVLACGISLAPRGLFDGRFWRSLVPALVSGAAMVATARALTSISSFAAAPIAVGAYVACLWLTGGLKEGFVAELRRLVESKLSRLRGAAHNTKP